MIPISNIKNKLLYPVYIIGLYLISYTCFAESDVKSKTRISKETLEEFSNYAEEVRKDWHVPGMAIALVQDGEIIYAQGFGKRNIKDDPVTESTIFDIASITKSFTATLLAMQIDEGKYTCAIFHYSDNRHLIQIDINYILMYNNFS
jgi:hypothetical protein